MPWAVQLLLKTVRVGWAAAGAAQALAGRVLGAAWAASGLGPVLRPQLRRGVAAAIEVLERRRLISARWNWWGDWAIAVLHKLPSVYSYVASCRPKVRPMLYAIGTAQWEERYLSPQYRAAQDVGNPRERLQALGLQQPIPDLFIVPVFSPAFCDDLAAELDACGCWEGGDRNTRDRYRTGWAPQDAAAAAAGLQTEAPAHDIALHKIMFDQHWQRIHNRYIRPLVRSQYSGYLTKGPRGVPFALRYYPPTGSWRVTGCPGCRHRLERCTAEGEDRHHCDVCRQPVAPGADILRCQKCDFDCCCKEGGVGQTPHHDDSVVTVNLSLSNPEEYEGGGCVFFRQQYVLRTMRKGEVAVHPGALTHFHAGIPVTSGRRCCLVSFYN